VRLLYQKKGGKDEVFAKVQAWFARRYRPRVQRLFRRLLAKVRVGVRVRARARVRVRV